MSEVTDTRAVLSKLAHEVSDIRDGWRRVVVGDGQPPEAAIVSELAETVLPSHLTFRNDKGDILSIEAGSRRIFRITAAPEDIGAEVQGPLGRDLDDADTDTTAQIVLALRRFCAGSGSVWVKSNLQEHSGQTTAIGLSVQSIRAALAEPVDAQGPDPTEAIAAFLAGITDQAEDWVLIEQSRVKAHSENGPNKDLCDTVAGLDFGAMTANTALPQLVTVGASEQNPTDLVLTWFDGWIFVAKATPMTPEAIGHAWRSAGL